jgi:hypothetical protein
VGLVSGGLLGRLIDNKDSSSGSSGSSVSGSVSSAANSVTGTTNDQGFFDENKGMITGALAGAASGVITDQFRKGEIERKYQEGYAKAKSDAIKELYWLKRDAQKSQKGGDDPPVQYRYYEVEVPAHTTSDGVLIDKHKRVIEVVE